MPDLPWKSSTFDDIADVLTDYVANGSFATLRVNVTYRYDENFAILLRTADYSGNFRGPFIYVDQKSYEFLGKSRVIRGDIVLANVGSVGTVFRAPDLGRPMTLGPNSVLLRTSQHDGFVYHWLCSNEGQARIGGIVGGNVQRKFNKTDFRTIEIELPSLPEQHQIADVLDTVDEAIRKTEQIIAKLKQVKQGLLHDLLTRGIDDNGELRDPDRHPEQFKDSPLGRIPKGWGVVRLDELAHFVTSGSRGWAIYYADDGALFVRIGNLTREHINLRLGARQHVRPPADGEGKRTALEPGDLLISITADLGIIGVVPLHLGEAYVNQHIALVRLDASRVNSRWIGHYLAAGPPREHIRRLDDGGAKAGLNLPTVRGLLVVVPHRAEQDRLASRVDALDERIREEATHSAKLRLLKSGLMEDLLTGRVRVTPLLEDAAE